MFNLKINGVSWRLTDKYSISEQIGAVASSSFDVALDDNAPPEPWDKIQVFDDLTLIYTGFVVSVDYAGFSSGYESQIYKLKSNSPMWILANRLISESWIGKTATEIVNSVFTSYLSSDGFTLGTIEVFAQEYAEFTANQLKAIDVLNTIADQVGAVIDITPDLVFNFYSRTNFTEVTPPTHIRDLKLQEDGAGIRTVQVIVGGTEKTSTQTQTIAWETGQASISLGYQVSEGPTVTVGGSSATVGIVGIDSESTTKMWLWSYGQASISYNSNYSGGEPASGAAIVITYKGYYDVAITVQNETLSSEISAKTGTSGMIESVETDTTITNYADGQALAEAYLNQNNESEKNLSLVCHDEAKSKTLNIWDMNYPSLMITGKFVIVERTITYGYDSPIIRVKLKNKNFYSRYGTIYNQYNKTIKDLTVGSGSLVYKTNSAIETLSMIDNFSVENGGIVYYPVGESSTDLIYPAIDGWYPE